MPIKNEDDRRKNKREYMRKYRTREYVVAYYKALKTVKKQYGVQHTQVATKPAKTVANKP